MSQNYRRPKPEESRDFEIRKLIGGAGSNEQTYRGQKIITKVLLRRTTFFVITKSNEV